ncbi:MAG: Oxidoreductase FAD-binding domain protein, partial [Phycisphaerales bacterium]|nr:Oxidoreductase FAD-binding domain protein [Phycisphaerales bacterium]
MKGLPFSRTVVAINGGVPLALVAWDAARGELGANPVNFAIRTTGLLSLIFLLLSLTVTPLRRVTGWNWLIGYRRSLGLWGFGYACVHLGIYVGFDRAMSLASTWAEVASRTYLQVGLAGVLLMVPLAATSTNGMIRRLGPRRWKALHRLAYAAAAAGALHYYMQAKSDVRQPLAFAGTLAGLLLVRAVWHYVDLRRAAARATPVRAPSAAAVPPRRKLWSGELVVARTFDETPGVRTFRLVPPAGGDLPFDYLPGQYMNLRLTVGGRPVNRSYTIASSPTRRGHCELTVKREEMGVSSGHLHREVRAGDRLKVSAPAGRFTFTGDGPDQPAVDGVVLIGGGVGITPVMSMARYLTDRSWPGEIYFVAVARTERDVLFGDELDALARRFPNFHLCVTLSRPTTDGAWAGPRGRLTAELLTPFVPDLARRPVYLCGPDEMMAAARRLLAELGVPAGRVHTEAFVSPGSQVADAGTAADAGRGGAVAGPSLLAGPANGAGGQAARSAGGGGGVAFLDPDGTSSGGD